MSTLLIITIVSPPDEDNLIVQHRQVMMFSQRLSRFSVIVPCKPSHPDIEMSLMIDKDVKASGKDNARIIIRIKPFR